MGYGIALSGIATVCALAWLILLASGRIAGWLGEDGLDAMCRFLGMLLIVIGVQLLADGVSGFIDSHRAGEVNPPLPALGEPGVDPGKPGDSP
jgi:small neutral amino acid transporter SnatA (MarC family)